MNLAIELENRVQEAPDRVGFIFEDGTSLTYRQIDEESSRISRAMELVGVKKGSHVVLFMQNSLQFVALLYGGWKIGAVMVPINVMYKEEELKRAVHKVNPTVMICEEDRLGTALRVSQFIPKLMVLSHSNQKEINNVESLQEIASTVSNSYYSAVACEEEDNAVILFTGGTTGEPKAVTITHYGWNKTLEDLAYANKRKPGPYPIADESKPPNIVASPLFHAGGMQTLLFALKVGRKVLLMERFRVERFLKLVEKYQLDSAVLMPTMLHDLVNNEGNINLSSIRSVMVTGGVLTPVLRKQFEEKFRIPILQNYGSTEVGHIAGWTTQDFKLNRWKPGAVGRIYPGVQLEIRNDRDEPVPAGEVGEICVKSEVTKEGYTGVSGEEQLKIVNGWVYTGDVGYVDEDRCLFIVGRKREMIKVGGFQVWPSEIEEVLLKHPQVREVAVVGVPDERLGEIPKAFIVLRQLPEEVGEEKRLKEEIINYCRDHLAHYKAVREVAFLESLPKNEAGKILRKELAENQTIG